MVNLDYSRDDLLTEFGKATLNNQYLLKDEKPQELFARVATAFADNEEHAQRLYDYMSQHWFMPATPILSNGGTDRGMPISCYLLSVEDDLKDIVRLWNEDVWLGARGGGLGNYLGHLRGIGENVGRNGKTSGIIPFIKVIDSLTSAISQGSLRRSSAAIYIPIDHPEIEEFLEIRKPTGGDPNRKALNIHHAVVISDAFMKAVEEDSDWNLISPKDRKSISSVSARYLWSKILTLRVDTGEPYILFIDTVNRELAEHHKKSGLKVLSSNLCTEILLPTGLDHHNVPRTAVCCLSSVNLEKWFEWKDNPLFVEDIMRFLDNVLQGFIDKAPPEMERARYSAMRERSVGLGVMGFHGFLQSQNVPFESAVAKVWNKRVFKHLRKEVDAASRKLAEERGACPDAAEQGIQERFSYKLAVAPTASISIIAGGSSPGIDLITTNAFLQKTLAGSFSVRNKYLRLLLQSKNKDNDETWSSIIANEGSVQHLDFLLEQEKFVFKTAFEVDQRWVIEHAADRTPYICQSQSVNLFLPANVHKKTLHDLHWSAWKKGVKSLYYCRSMSLQRADKVSQSVKLAERETSIDDSECLACQ